MSLQTTLKRRPLVAKVQAAAQSAGFTPLQSRLLAGRLTEAEADDLSTRVRPTVRQLDGPETLPDIDAAADRIALAVMRREQLLAVTDFDCDGTASAWVLTKTLRDVFGHPPDRLHHFAGHRMRDGYGVSGLGPALVITADQGSNNHEQISRLKANSIETVVSDHHEMGEPPKDAVACVSPARKDSLFPDPCIAGAHVAWLICCATRQRLIDFGHLGPETPRLGSQLDVVSIATIADCTSLGRSRNNRAVVAHGLALMNSNPRPAWLALREVLGKTDDFTESDLGFGLGPMINAASRVDDSKPALSFLLSEDYATALHYAQRLKDYNLQRREIERGMREKASAIARGFVDTGAVGIVVHLDDGHIGVIGIVAARVAQETGRPTACLAPKPDKPGMLSASLRSVPGIDIRSILADIAARHPTCMASWGGHKAASGASLHIKDLPLFVEEFDAGVRRQTTAELHPYVLTDGELDAPSLPVLPEIATLAPFGREFEPPVFEMAARIVNQRGVGDGSHLKLTVCNRHGEAFDGIWFSAVRPGQASPVAEGQPVRLAYVPEANHFRGNTKLQLRVQAALATAE